MFFYYLDNLVTSIPILLSSRTSNKTKQLINDLTIEARNIENINIKDREKMIL